MPSILRYGTDSSIQLNFAEGVLVAECGEPNTPLLDAPAVEVAQVLRTPLNYPPLAQSVTPADRVVLVLEPGLPQVEMIVAEVIGCLVEAGLDADALTVLRTSDDAASETATLRSSVPHPVRQRVAIHTHDPTDRQELAYLTTTGQGSPILLNRAITDADMVIPIGRFQSPLSPGNFGVHGVVFPTFSDHKTQLRLPSAPSSQPHSRSQHARFLQECDEVGWLLGVTFTIQIVPGPGETILHVLAGEAAAVAAQGQHLYQAAWGASVPRRAQLVVAAVEGGARHQTWRNVGAALEMAGALVEEGGAIAVCCDLAVEPGPGLRQLRAARSRRQVIREIRKDHPEDFLPATQLARALDRADVYLLSRLQESIVEDLEMAPIAEPQELVRLTQRCSSCILVSNAPYAMVTASEDAG